MSVEEKEPLQELPLLALRGALVFPGMVVPLNVGRPRSVAAVEAAVLRDRRIVLASQKEFKQDDPQAEDIFEVGTLALLKHVTRTPDGTIRVVAEGLSRCRVVGFLQSDPYFKVLAREAPDARERTQETEALMRTVIQQYERYVRLSRKVPPESVVTVVNMEEPGRLADTIAAHLALKPEDKQEVLAAIPLKERLEKVSSILTRETELLELEKRINVRVRKQMEKTQREYYLREQMKAIQRELGERDERGDEAEEYRTKIEKLALPKEVAERALREVERLEKMPPMVAEAVVVRTYLDWILALPWTFTTEDCLDIKAAERILEEDHYGLKNVKERILEYLAVRKLVQEMKGPILCLIGPPGVGKTSLAKSVARALNRRFVRISLGGVRDEAEIRGHRRTYVGALPGRIIQGMKQAGSKNPVFLLDEVDKMSSDFRGDPAAALLEVLDPEQNCNFSDHYIEMAFDLSRVLFITTANLRYNIPRALLDRMEAIELPGYTEEEKVKIASRYLLPRQLKEHGLQPSSLRLSENVIRQIIRLYTREAGVRNLERELASVCRKVAKGLASGGPASVRVTAQNLHGFLGPPRFFYGAAEKRNEVGVAMGVGWTDTGGDILPIEVTVMKGKGNLLLTGKLGEVMRESAQAGLSYVRSRTKKLSIPEDFYENCDLHVHVPEGAMPKEGPSAGIAMATACSWKSRLSSSISRTSGAGKQIFTEDGIRSRLRFRKAIVSSSAEISTKPCPLRWSASSASSSGSPYRARTAIGFRRRECQKMLAGSSSMTVGTAPPRISARATFHPLTLSPMMRGVMPAMARPQGRPRHPSMASEGRFRHPVARALRRRAGGGYSSLTARRRADGRPCPHQALKLSPLPRAAAFIGECWQARACTASRYC
ncbi:MAG: endopeptidase La [Anaerolineae bacterium]|nr:endopeptidase La [Anaerolineae bacterium]